MTYRAYAVPRRCRLLLEELEKSYGHKEPAVLEAATIEHVMPQTLTDEWRQMLDAGEGVDSLHELCRDTIGNLTLSAYNPELSNLSFVDKKHIYATSHYSLNGWFAGREVWTQVEIQERSDALWEIAKGLWPGPVL